VIGLGSRSTIISAGLYSTCALTRASHGNAASCWGTNFYGSLGDGTTDPSLVPVAVTGMQIGVTSISPYYNTTCGVRDGAVKCWGYNIYGMVGDGTDKERHVPRLVVGLTRGTEKVGAGLYSTCALRASGGVRCWGFGDDGQLGDGKGVLSLVPVRVHLI